MTFLESLITLGITLGAMNIVTFLFFVYQKIVDNK